MDEHKEIKKQKFVDEEAYYSSEFKRDFVKGIIELANRKGIKDIQEIVKEVAPTLSLHVSDAMIWVTSFTLIFAVEK